MDNATRERPANAASLLTAIVAVEGSAHHGHVQKLLGSRPVRRDLADAVHALCLVHGTRPGMIDVAHGHGAQPDASDWLAHAAAGFAGERAMLVRLAARIGPLPSTPGQAESEAALVGVARALAMLARSDRGGCATGAAAALIADWPVIRAILAVAATDAGVEIAATTLPAAAVNATAVAALGSAPAAERAMGFGAHQLLAQHRGLWDLMAARAAARDRLDPHREPH